MKLIQSELERQAGQPPEETHGVSGLLSYWRSLDPNAEIKAWMTGVLESGRWSMPDALGLFVPIGTMSAGGPPVAALGDPNIELLDDVLGIEETLALLGSAPDASGTDWHDTDVSYPNRIRHASSALADG